MITSTLAISGIAMAPLPVWVVASTLVLAVAFAFVLDTAKVLIFARLKIV
jgi:H+-transporting ATPase